VSVPVPYASSRLFAALATAVLTAVVATVAQQGFALLAVLVGALQLLALVCLLAARPPSPRGVAAVGVLTGGAADVVATSAHSLAPLAGVLGLSVLAAIVVQLARGVARARVTEAMAATLGAGVAVVALASLLVLHRQRDGADLVTLTALAAGAGLLTAAAINRFLPVPRLAAGLDRGGLALVVGTVAGAFVGVLGSARLLAMSRPPAALVAGSVALVAVLVDLAAAYAGATAGSSRPSNSFLVGGIAGLCAGAPLTYVLVELVAR